MNSIIRGQRGARKEGRTGTIEVPVRRMREMSTSEERGHDEVNAALRERKKVKGSMQTRKGKPTGNKPAPAADPDTSAAAEAVRAMRVDAIRAQTESARARAEASRAEAAEALAAS